MAVLAPRAPQASTRVRDIRCRNSACVVAAEWPRPATNLRQVICARRGYIALVFAHAHPPPLPLSACGARGHVTAPRNRTIAP